jgi:CHAT domain-containing protein
MPLGRALPRTGRPRPPNSTLRFLLVCSDPVGDLPAARTEVERIAAALQDRPDAVEVVTRFDQQATGAMLNDALRGGEFDVLHYAGHAAFHGTDPDLSGLLLHGRETFYAEKIQRLVEGQPLVFLNACQTGRAANENVAAHTTSYLGRPAGGLATAFLYGGALACIGSLWPVYDDAAAHFAITFYHQLVDGNLVGEAVRKARESTYQAFPGQVTWAAYSLNGDPTFRIATPSFAQPARPANR